MKMELRIQREGSGEHFHLYLIVTVFLLVISLAQCRPFAKPNSDDSSSSDYYANFDSKRQSPSTNSSHMIVRVIVTSSSSSSSSGDNSNSDENISSGNDEVNVGSYHHDFTFPIQKESSSSTTTTTTLRPKTLRITTPPSSRKTSVKQRRLKSSTSTSSTPVTPLASEGPIVEDIFSAFYRAFSQNSESSPSDNVERFQFYFPSSTSTTTTSKPLFNLHPYPYSDQRNVNLDKNVLRREIPSSIASKEVKVVQVSKSTSSSIDGNGNDYKSNVKSFGSSRTPPVGSSSRRNNRILSTSIRQSSSYTDGNIPIGLQKNNNQQLISAYHNQRRIPNRVRIFSSIREPSPLPSTSIKNFTETENISRPMITTAGIATYEEPKASALVQPLSATTESSPTYRTSSLPKSSWQLPEKRWAEEERSWAQKEHVWGQQEKVWAEKETQWSNLKSSTTTPSTLPPPSHVSMEDEDYPRDSPYDDEVKSQSPLKEEPGSFVILGDDESEQDSIDGEFDHHLGIPTKLMPPSRSKPTSTEDPSSQISISSISSSSSKLDNFSFNYYNSSYANISQSQQQSPTPSVSRSSNDMNSDSDTSTRSGGGKKFGYVLEGSNVRRYRVEERTPDGFIVGEYGVLNNQNAFLRGVRYTADGTINPRLIHEALMKFLALRR